MIKDVIIHKKQGGPRSAYGRSGDGDQMAGGVTLPTLFAPDANTAERVIEFFTACIRNPNTRKAYVRATVGFAAWCADQGIGALGQIPANAATLQRCNRITLSYR